jgi:hypothetical protein
MGGTLFYKSYNLNHEPVLTTVFKTPLFSLTSFFFFCFPRRHSKVRDSDEENDADDEDAIASAVGCLGPFSGLLAPELQKYQKQIKGKELALDLDYLNLLVPCHRALLLCPLPASGIPGTGHYTTLLLSAAHIMHFSFPSQ